jgi:uncharacterized membrane protein YbhN (UPF0104 family)
VQRTLAVSHLEQDAAHAAFFIVLAGVLAAGALGGIVATTTGVDALTRRLVSPQWEWLAVAFGATVVSYLGYVLAYRETARAEEGPELPFRHVGALVMGGFGLFIPRGGFALDVEALAVHGVPPREARVKVLSLSTLEYAVLAPAAFVVAVVLMTRSWPAELSVRLSWAIGVPVGAAIALWLLRHRESFRRAGGWRGHLAHGLDAIAHTMRLWRRPHCGLLAFLGMAVYWAADIFALWACVAVFAREGTRPGAAHIILAYATGYALTRRALPLAGAGAVEALLPFALLWTGVALATAVLAVAAYRLFNLWLPLLPAAIAVLVLRREHVARDVRERRGVV